MKRLKLLGVSSIIIVLGLGCAGKPKNVAEDSTTVTNEAAKEAGADKFVEIEFEPGSSQLSERSRASIKALVDQSLDEGELTEVKILSWSDEEYPTKKQNKLSKAQRDLADKRNESVEKYVKSLKRVDVDSYNMAKQPNPLEDLFGTKDAQLKNTLVSAGLPTTADDIKYPSKASHSVIMVRIE